MFGLLSFKIEFHMLKLFKILVFDFLSESLFFSSDFFSFSSVLLFNGINHIIEFFKMVMMSLLHLLPLSEVLLFKYVHISSELFHKTLNSWVLNGKESVDVNEVVSNGYLILVVRFIKVFIKHLDEGFLGIKLSLIVLRVDIYLISKFFCFSYSHDLSPVGE